MNSLLLAATISNEWIDIIKSLGSAFIYAVIGSYSAFKGWMAAVDKYISAQVKTSTDFIDTRIALKLNLESEKNQIENKYLKDKIDVLEHDYKLFNEERIKEMKEFFKEYK